MKPAIENAMQQESNDDGLFTIVTIPLGSGDPVSAKVGDAIVWTFNQRFTVTITPSGVVSPLSYVANFINGRWEASGGSAMADGRCTSSYGGTTATVPPNVIIVDPSTDDK